MPKCALCESTQPLGDTCDVCGRPFPAAEAVPVVIQPLPDLEATTHEAAWGDERVDRLADLVPTAEGDVGLVAPGERVEGFSPTAAEPVAVVVAPLEVERVGDDAALDATLEPAAPARVSCRYCRTPASEGDRICPVCGMRLPLARPPPAAAAEGAVPCGDCGLPMTGTQCRACGARRGAVR